jgi:hypothetical protein
MKGITKGIATWNKIEKEIYDREAKQEIIEIIDEEQIFEMNLHKFKKMLNVKRWKNPFKPRRIGNYRIDDFQVNKDYIFQIWVSYRIREYLERLGFDFDLIPEYGDAVIMD